MMSFLYAVCSNDFTVKIMFRMLQMYLLHSYYSVARFVCENGANTIIVGIFIWVLEAVKVSRYCNSLLFHYWYCSVLYD